MSPSAALQALLTADKDAVQSLHPFCEPLTLESGKGTIHFRGIVLDTSSSNA